MIVFFVVSTVQTQAVRKRVVMRIFELKGGCSKKKFMAS
jgi:hypothetical protein